MLKIAVPFFLLIFLSILLSCYPQRTTTIELNTSNPGKLKEYRRLFLDHGIHIHHTQIDLDEIDSDPLSVIVHKVSQMKEGILVEDTSLHIEGTDIGIHIRWFLDRLEEHLNQKATWTVFLAMREHDTVYVYKGEVTGTIVSPHPQIKGEFGFDPYFLPNGSTKTLAEEKPDHFNARAIAVQALMDQQPFATRRAIYEWDGPWQQHE